MAETAPNPTPAAAPTHGLILFGKPIEISPTFVLMLAVVAYLAYERHQQRTASPASPSAAAIAQIKAATRAFDAKQSVVYRQLAGRVRSHEFDALAADKRDAAIGKAITDGLHAEALAMKVAATSAPDLAAALDATADAFEGK